MAYIYYTVVYGRVISEVECQKNPDLESLFSHLTDLADRGWPGVETHMSDDNGEITCSVGWAISHMDPGSYISADRICTIPTAEQMIEFERATAEVVQSLTDEKANLFLSHPCKSWFVRTYV